MLIICILESSEYLYSIHWFYGTSINDACENARRNCNMSAILMGRRYSCCVHTSESYVLHMVLLHTVPGHLFIQLYALHLIFTPFLSLASKCFSLCACNYCRIENVWKCATVSAHKKNHFKTMVFLPIRYTWGVNDSFAQNEKTLHAEAKVTCWQNQRISMKSEKKIEDMNKITRARETPIRRDIKTDEWTNVCLYKCIDVMEVIEAGKTNRAEKEHSS